MDSKQKDRMKNELCIVGVHFSHAKQGTISHPTSGVQGGGWGYKFLIHQLTDDI